MRQTKNPAPLAGGNRVRDIAERRSDPRSTFASREPVTTDIGASMRLRSWRPLRRDSLLGGLPR